MQSWKTVMAIALTLGLASGFSPLYAGQHEGSMGEHEGEHAHGEMKEGAEAKGEAKEKAAKEGEKAAEKAEEHEKKMMKEGSH